MTAYATRTELYALGVSDEALTDVSTTDQDTALESASRTVDSYLRGRYGTPFPSPYPYELREKTCHVAAWNLMSTRGFNPSGGMDEAVRLRYEDAIKWLTNVARGVVVLDNTADATPNKQEAAPLISSDTAIDWDA